MSNMVEVVTYQRMKAKVNPRNPAFNTFTGRRNKFIEVFAIISDGTKEWREKFKVSNMDVAEEQVKEVIQFFNDTRRPEPPMEKERNYVSLYLEDGEVKRYTDDYGMSGWLDPEGIFHPCGFGEHVRYALDLAEKAGERFQAMDGEDIEDLAENQHIPMSNAEQSSMSFMSILSDITPPQVEWFNRFFYKLSPTQRTTLSNAAKKQGIVLKYDW